MSARIYITSIEGNSGKSSVALGVVDTLLSEAPKVGVFRPLVRTHKERDRILTMLLKHSRSQLPYEDCVGVTYEKAHQNPRQALSTIVEKFKRLEAKCDATVIVGSDFSDVAFPTELTFNAQIAANLDAPVLLVLGGRINQRSEQRLGQLAPRTPQELAQVADLARGHLSQTHARLLGVIVNRTDREKLDETVSAIQKVLPEHVPTWAIPENQLLVAPPVAAVLESTGGELVRGSVDLLDREVLGLVVAGMSMERVLPRLQEGALLIIAADRSETLLAVTMAHEATTFPTIAAIIINGDFPLSKDVSRLLDGIDSSLPVIRVKTSTFDTVLGVLRARGVISQASPRKFDIALSSFHTHVDAELLRSRMQVDRGTVRTPIMFAYELFERAKESASHIVLPEGQDDRILRAASSILTRKIAQLTILGEPGSIRKRAAELGLHIEDATIINPTKSALLPQFASEYAKIRKHKGITYDQAHERMQDVSYFGTMMVQLGFADGMVSGAAHTTAHTIKPSFEIIKTKPGVSVVSSVFFMALADRVLVYGDCAVNPDPSAEQLADIAISSAETAAQFGVDPRVAMLSYSTGTSGSGADVDKVRIATELAQQRRPDLPFAGPIQYDAASDPNTGKSKLPGSRVAGRATVFIFPDLNTGNNTYKAVQRSANAVAVGPVLQGLNKPVNDLSRGATVTDIINTVAITAVQAGMSAAEPTTPTAGTDAHD
ncbi:phosphate acetyltransferase [Canibacter sp. lx-45]|uniref:phosphate acetyltransferase n=1 Tax=Canibacter zhuwentaonis TaxID=2837491 RepID=UPI001BDDA90D|nr:phosphate acetyltransferase [Canibacter zhuwentaonis]